MILNSIENHLIRKKFQSYNYDILKKTCLNKSFIKVIAIFATKIDHLLRIFKTVNSTI
ncbi:hypothetical protein BFAG_03849 [Bacteroides fragilis 3_1_12]|uniref:Uncharacterized protein n=1 Tax=Bacteroides fragilis 3_1_12 TaxID=457424 RepID=A0ABN0BQG8_BACFG|nr:hypothetical protein BFAG_03849 [Bacteroides fragilis 3_1_12]